MRYIASWEWDEGNLSELAGHGLNPGLVVQVSTEAPKFRRNLKSRAASHQMVGPDQGGTFWVICIVENQFHDGVWRAITGWRAESQDESWYRRAR